MMPMPPISASDALFTLSSSSQYHHNHTSHTNLKTGKGGGVTGVCFVKDPTSTISCSRISSDSDCSEGSPNSDTSDDDEIRLQFKCSELMLGPQHYRNNSAKGDYFKPYLHAHATHLSAASDSFLSGAILASCHNDGSCKIWDLATRRCIMNDFSSSDCLRRAPGLAIRRLGLGSIDQANEFLYQTRDQFGTVTLHDLNCPTTPLLQIRTHSSTFCAMSPCFIGSETPPEDVSMGAARNLVALPTEEHSVAVVRDLRCNPRANPAWKVTVGDDFIGSMYGSRRKFGMITSLTLCMQEATNNIILGCGMENGSALFYDLGLIGHGHHPWWYETRKEDTNFSDMSDEAGSVFMCCTSLGRDPVLCMDLVSSRSADKCSEVRVHKGCDTAKSSSASMVAIAGCAGDADTISESPENEQGTVSTIKVKLANRSKPELSLGSSMNASVRSKTRTCSLESGGKVGVSICRFRPDGRIFAVGGWDHRLRLFGRTTSKPLAILRGHEESVTAIDWASNAARSGLLATGSGDGRICLWRVFPHSKIQHGTRDSFTALPPNIR